MELTRINNDVNGNPRYVVHFLELNTEAEKARSSNAWIEIQVKYDIALRRAHSIGGRKFHNKQFGGGIVFKCYGEADLKPHIDRVMKNAESDERQAENLFLSVVNDGSTYKARQDVVRMFYRDRMGSRAYKNMIFAYSEMLRAESRKPYNRGTKISETAIVLAAHDLHAYMIQHYKESNNGADWECV